MSDGRQAEPPEPPGTGQPGTEQPAGAQPAEEPEAGGQAAGEQPQTGPEHPDADPDAPNPKANAADPANARKLHRDNRAMEDAVAALLGERGAGIGNVFVANTIGLVDAGRPRAGEVHRRTVPTGPIPPETLNSVLAAFVAPANYRDLRQRLRERRLVLLRAPAGWGRTATALNLLGVECADGVDKLSPDTDLRSPTAPVDLVADHGYLLESLEYDQAAGLTEFALDLWARRLADAGARMVVLVGTDTPLRNREPAAYLVDGAPRTDDLALVLSHFRVGLRDLGEPERDLAEFPECADLVEEVAGRSLRARDLADLGRGLCLVVRGERDVEEVRRRYARNAETALREWFRGLPDHDHRAFAIALAVFDGMPLATVAEAATVLAELIQAAEVPDANARTRALFAVRTLELVERVEAELTSAVEDGEFGSLTLEVVRYRDPHRTRQVLEHVWREYTEAHRVVRRWLRELGSSPDRQVRIRAGVAVGLLSLSEFEHARRHVIEPWAGENKYWERQAVIGALRLPALQPELQPLIVRMIDRWLRGKTASGTRVAAVDALGALPVMTAEQVLKRLRRAADTASPRMVIAVADCVTNLALDPDRLDLVLGALLQWSWSVKVGLRTTALHCVLQLTVFLEATPEGGVEPWPGLLWAAELDRHAAAPTPRVAVGSRRLTRWEAVVALVARALEAQYFMPETFDVIHRWVKTAERDPSQREPLGALLADVVATTGDRSALRFYLGEWARARRGPTATATALLAHLDREEVRP
ncbi:hypothetical protein [Saccharothrix syringae]|uniref:LigA protein n=1 Tax=Saccharothrix syringae TaxID=103733 RepID=A0A5Q0GSM7_SACSY|nr:hypothetical protein [Saccharothrix syringae]QFZ16989.1 hypothetical protein EKG83_05475 [Saccharothrix syringae]